MSFKPKWTAEQIETAREIVNSVPHRERGLCLAATALNTTSGAVRSLLERANGRRSKAQRTPKGRIHIVIGDTQVKPGVPTQHLGWIGRYIAEQFVGQDVVVIHLGDHWDMPSLSKYDEHTIHMEGLRYADDVVSGNEGFRTLHAPIAKAMKQRRKWKPRLVFLRGNHEHRITREIEEQAIFQGKVSLDDLDTCGWEVHPFREVVDIDGIAYSHYFYNPNTSRPYAGENLLPRLKTIGRSFTMGHQQGLMYTLRPVGLKRQHGLVLGSTYLHDERYLGPQAVAYWRGIVVCHQVEDGQYDPMFVSLDYLCRRYEGKTLAKWMAE